MANAGKHIAYLLQIGEEGKTFQHQSHQSRAAWINSHCMKRKSYKTLDSQYLSTNFWQYSCVKYTLMYKSLGLAILLKEVSLRLHLFDQKYSEK